MDILNLDIALFLSIVSLCLGIYAIRLSLKAEIIFNKIKEHIEVFFEKDRLLRGYDYHKESFKQIINKLEDIEIVKEKNRKTMPENYFSNKSKRGQHGFLVKIISSESILQKNSYYFIFFRLSFVRDLNANLKILQGCWLITKTIDKNNTKYPFIFKPEANQSFNLTADEFMEKK